MDFSKQKKDFLLGLCKLHGLKGYSKLTKDDLIDKLLKAGITADTVSVPASTDKVVVAPATVKPVVVKKKIIKSIDTKPKSEKLFKKLEKSLTCDSIKKELKELGKLEKDITDDSILELVKSKTANFIKSSTLTPEDFKRYVDDYGVIKIIIEFVKTTPTFNFKEVTEEQLYNTLAVFLFEKDSNIYDSLVKKCKKFLPSLYKVDKPLKPLKPLKPKTIKEKPPLIDDTKEPEDSDDEIIAADESESEVDEDEVEDYDKI
jgi:hypothetical protein